MNISIEQLQPCNAVPGDNEKAPESSTSPALANNKHPKGRTFKKSMLNDNRLLKLRDKFLKRSKSSAGTLSVEKATASASSSAPPSADIGTIEEHQNKENECPAKMTSSSLSCSTTSSSLSAPSTPTKRQSDAQHAAASTTKWISSPSRNRVLMGTRAISKTLLNKSLDNVYDSVRGTRRGRKTTTAVSSVLRQSSSDDEEEDEEEAYFNDEGVSSSSFSSMGYGGGSKNRREKATAPKPKKENTEAYVIRKYLLELRNWLILYYYHRPEIVQ